jgi:predicted nucleotidyltransferase
MRLTAAQIRMIIGAVSDLAGTDANVYLFGSRLDDQARGGDVDLLIESARPLSVLDRARITHTLEQQLGLPVDVIAVTRGADPTPFQQIARARGSRLEAT